MLVLLFNYYSKKYKIIIWLFKQIELPYGDPEDKSWDPKDADKTTVCALGNTKDGYFNDALEEQGAQVYHAYFYFINVIILSLILT